MRFRQVRGRPHEETPVHRGPVSVGSLLVAVTLKPWDELPDGMHLEDVLTELGGVVAASVSDWYHKRGHEFCVSVPDVA
jgi:hypothetical protein